MDSAYFFRAVEDAAAPEVSIRFLAAFLLVLMLLAAYVKAPKVYALVAISLQTAILFWYGYSKILLPDGLPLYHCRISLWVISMGILFEKRSKFILWLSYLGIAMSLAVLLMRDMNRYAFPHITNFYYFLGHGAIFLISVSYIEKCEERLSVRQSLIYALVLHGPILLVDIFLNSNYAYLRRLPLINSSEVNKYSFFIVTLTVVATVLATQRIVGLKPVRSFLMRDGLRERKAAE